MMSSDPSYTNSLLGPDGHRRGWIKWLLSWKLGFQLRELIRQGNCYSRRSRENSMTLKRSSDVFTVEKKQNSPGLVAAATHGWGGLDYQLTRSRQGTRQCVPLKGREDSPTGHWATLAAPEVQPLLWTPARPTGTSTPGHTGLRMW